MYMFADCGKICVNVSVGKANNFQSTGIQDGRPLGIAGKSLFLVMLETVDFDDELCLMAVKINDESIYGFLALKADGVRSQKKVPEFSFFRRHVLSQLFGQRNQSLFISE